MDKKEGLQNGESIVGPSVKIDGDLKSQGNLRIDGTVTGKVKTSQNLFVGESAKISADVEAENAIISGVVQGNVKVSGALVLGKTGRLVGDMSCGTLQVEEGAYFGGKCTMKDANGGIIEPIEENATKKK
ncbi:MAG: bactofilin family protein [Candidatus Doudnabacteria bacterium]